MASSVSILFKHFTLLTPPKHLDSTEFLDDAIASLDIIYPNADTPPPSSPLESSLPGQTSGLSKRLRFSSEPPSYFGDLPQDCQSSPLTEGYSQKLAKSILKASEPLPLPTPPNHIQTQSGHTFPPADSFHTFAAMLQSVMQALSGTDQNSRRDAYNTLAGCLKSFKAWPDNDSLLAQLGLLEISLERDISAKTTSSVQRKVAEQAVQCAHAILQRVPSQVSLRFQNFLIDQAILAMENHCTPKESIRNHLKSLALEELYGKAMTTERTRKILKGMLDIEQHWTGNGVIVLRLMIYRRIACHAPNLIVDEVQHPIKHIFHSLLSSNKDLRIRAIEAAFALGTSTGYRQRTIRAMNILLETRSPDGTEFSNHIKTVLNGMASRPHELDHVPQIWGVVMLLLKGSHTLLEKLLLDKSWLAIIQICFNKKDQKLNRSTWTAWNHAIFACSDLMLENEAVLKRLSHPIIGHLQRDFNEFHSSAYSSFYLLFYQAFGQPISKEKMEVCWKRLVHEVCRMIFVKSRSPKDTLSFVVTSLLSGPGIRIWNAERALHVAHTPMSIAEIPRLDAAWVRTNIHIVLSTLEMFIDPLTQFNFPDEAFRTLWSGAIQAIVQAGEKEIKASPDLKKAVASIMTALYSWSSTRTALKVHQMVGYCFSVCVDSFGADLMTEPFLRRSQETGSFEFLTSPKKGKTGYVAVGEAPVVSAFRLLVHCVEKLDISIYFDLSATRVLSCVNGSRRSTWSKVQQLSDIFQLFPVVGQLRPSTSQLWQALAGAIVDILDHEHKQATTVKPLVPQLAQEFRNMVDILQFGLRFSDKESQLKFKRLHQIVCQVARDFAGNAGDILAVAIPSFLWLKEKEGAVIPGASRYLAAALNSEHPRPDDRAMAFAKQVLGTISGQGSFTFHGEWLEALNLLSELVGVYLTKVYNGPEPIDDEGLSLLMLAVSTFFMNMSQDRGLSHQSFLQAILKPLLPGIMAWVMDQSARPLSDMSDGHGVHVAIGLLWQRVVKFCFKNTSHIPEFLEDCMISGLRSHKKTIANIVVSTWNDQVQKQEAITCPPKMLPYFVRLRDLADVQGLLDVPASQIQLSPVLSQQSNEQLFPWLTTRETQFLTAPSPPRRLHSGSLSASPRSLLARSPLRTTPRKLSSRSPLQQQTPPARLRHNDSQVHFHAIDSSPINPQQKESQLLTNHQKEARERQMADSALFANIHSSPPKSSASRAEPNITEKLATAKVLSTQPKVQVQPQYLIEAKKSVPDQDLGQAQEHGQAQDQVKQPMQALKDNQAQTQENKSNPELDQAHEQKKDSEPNGTSDRNHSPEHDIKLFADKPEDELDESNTPVGATNDRLEGHPVVSIAADTTKVPDLVPDQQAEESSPPPLSEHTDCEEHTNVDEEMLIDKKREDQRPSVAEQSYVASLKQQAPEAVQQPREDSSHSDNQIAPTTEVIEVDESELVIQTTEISCQDGHHVDIIHDNIPNEDQAMDVDEHPDQDEEAASRHISNSPVSSGAHHGLQLLDDTFIPSSPPRGLDDLAGQFSSLRDLFPNESSSPPRFSTLSYARDRRQEARSVSPEEQMRGMDALFKSGRLRNPRLLKRHESPKVVEGEEDEKLNTQKDQVPETQLLARRELPALQGHVGLQVSPQIVSIPDQPLQAVDMAEGSCFSVQERRSSSLRYSSRKHPRIEATASFEQRPTKRRQRSSTSSQVSDSAAPSKASQSAIVPDVDLSSHTSVLEYAARTTVTFDDDQVIAVIVPEAGAPTPYRVMQARKSPEGRKWLSERGELPSLLRSGKLFSQDSQSRPSPLSQSFTAIDLPFENPILSTPTHGLGVTWHGRSPRDTPPARPRSVDGSQGSQVSTQSRRSHGKLHKDDLRSLANLSSISSINDSPDRGDHQRITHSDNIAPNQDRGSFSQNRDVAGPSPVQPSSFRDTKPTSHISDNNRITPYSQMTARGVLERLRALIGDVKGMVFVAQNIAEKEELEDAALELQREIVQAGRRGRARG